MGGVRAGSRTNIYCVSEIFEHGRTHETMATRSMHEWSGKPNTPLKWRIAGNQNGVGLFRSTQRNSRHGYFFYDSALCYFTLRLLSFAGERGILGDLKVEKAGHRQHVKP